MDGDRIFAKAVLGSKEERLLVEANSPPEKKMQRDDTAAAASPLPRRLDSADPEKSDGRRELVCSFLARPENAIQIARLAYPEGLYGEGCALDDSREIKVTVRTEIPIGTETGRGSIRYCKTPIGFVDGFMNIKIPVKRNEPKTPAKSLLPHYFQMCRRPPVEDVCETRMRPFFIEVKTSTVGVGEILRQIAFYKEYISTSAHAEVYEGSGVWRSIPWVVATTFEFTAAQADELRRADIYWIHLGSKFETWYRQQSGRKGQPGIRF